MSKIIVIVGATATGKTKASIEIAKEYNAQIINADSTAIYKEPLIATAKVTKKEQEEVKHHMIDLVSLNDDYTLYDFQKDGRKVLDNLIKKNINVVITGGSGLYVKALLYDYTLNESKKSDLDLSKYTNQELKKMADDIFKNNNIHVNNRQRLERFIKYNDQTGQIITKTDNINNRIYDFELIGLRSDRNTLYDNINKRTDQMVKDGLLEEARVIYEKNFKNFTNIIGFKELDLYFKNEISLEDAIELIKQNTRKYAKRQFTWFNNQMKDIKWFDVNYDNFDITINEIKNYLSNSR